MSDRRYATGEVDPYLAGLLPEDEWVLRMMGPRSFYSNPFAMLAERGLDCAGSVQFLSDEEEPLCAGVGPSCAGEDLVPLTEEEIAERLRPAARSAADVWLREGERWTLGGNQPKFALRLRDGAWCECHGAAATTHIFKPGISGMRLQALSVMPSRKYATLGGPGTPRVPRVLRKTTDPASNTRLFASMLFFNYLAVSPDAHAKNYSLLHLPSGECALAPLYDAASALPYDRKDEGVHRLAMPIGGESRQGHVGREEIERFADAAQMDRERCVDLMAGLCERIIERAPEAADDAIATGADGACELVERLLPRLESHCRATLRQL